MNMTNEGSPAADTIEVSIFGPGVGECCVLHLGDGKWFIVDSCTDNSGKPVALRYLQRIGVDISKDVKGILVTHWHDDHIGGVAELYRQASSAKFYCSAAFDSKDLLQLLALQRGVKISGSGGCDELAGVFATLANRKPKHSRIAEVGPELVKAGQVLVRDGELTLQAMSPSSKDIIRARQAFAEMLPQVEKAKRRLVGWHENDASVVLVLTCGDQAVLLGADRETSNHDHTGWTAILDSEVRPQKNAEVYKVPHHGSDNGDRPEIWNELLAPQPISVVTPYRNSGLPKDSDLARLRQKTTRLYLTAPVHGGSPTSYTGDVEMQMLTNAKERQLLRSGLGQVRVRFAREDSGGSIAVNCFGTATKHQTS